MASAYFIWRQFEDVLIYLSSIKVTSWYAFVYAFVQAYFPNDDIFNFNYGQSLLYCENFIEAEEAFLLVNGPQITSLLTYQLGLSRACNFCPRKSYPIVDIKNKKGELAWNLYQKERNSRDAGTLLKLIANDCYREEEFLYSAKAFEEMEKRDSRANYSAAKQGAVMGVIKLFSTGRISM